MTTPDEAPRQAPPSPWMTLQETADYLRMSYDYVARLANAGKIRRSKGDGQNAKVLIHRDDADAFVLARMNEETAPRPARGRRGRPQPKTSAAAS